MVMRKITSPHQELNPRAPIVQPMLQKSVHMEFINLEQSKKENIP
jgi:hypothetical protein